MMFSLLTGSVLSAPVNVLFTENHTELNQTTIKTYKIITKNYYLTVMIYPHILAPVTQSMISMVFQ